MKSGRLIVLLAFGATACSPVQVVEAELLPGGHVRISIPPGMNKCIQRLELKGHGGDWEIQGYDAPGCVKSVEFPLVPLGFKEIVPAKSLAPGRYTIGGKANEFYLDGEFIVPAP